MFNVGTNMEYSCRRFRQDHAGEHQSHNSSDCARLFVCHDHRYVHGLGAVCQGSGASSAVIWIFRGTHLLVQLFLAYYGFPKIGIVLNSFVCAVIVFSLNEGAYCAETMRSALEAVPEGQMEAGYCVGMNYLQIMRHVVIPQALRTAFPPLSNSVIAMLKDTSLVAEITVADMFMAAQKIVGRTYEPLWLYCEVALIYLFFSTILTFVQRYFEKRLSAYNSRETEVRTQE